MRRVLITALAALAVVASAGATPHARNGLIAFARYRFVNSPLREEIWVERPDGTGARRLTVAGPNSFQEGPDWSPDGSTILYSECAPGGGLCDGRSTIWSVRAAGGSPIMLSAPCPAGSAKDPARCPDENRPRYSPDGRRIAFALYDGRPALAVGDTRLQHLRVIRPFGDAAGVPDIDAIAWSADGRRLAIDVHNDNSHRFAPYGGRAVYVVGADGHGLRRITPWSLRAGELDWSPDGRSILFRSVTFFSDAPGPSQGDIYTVDPDGSHLRRLTHFPPGTPMQLGSYSPDGTKIVFTKGLPGAFPDLFTMNADGSGIRRVAETRNWEGFPDWGLLSPR